MSSQPQLDLDQVVRELTGLRPGWVKRGITAGQLTWRDAQAAWPKPVVTDRTTVAEPESVGMTLTAANGTEAILILWRGGWADIDLLLLGSQVSPAHLTSTTLQAASPWLNPERLGASHIDRSQAMVRRQRQRVLSRSSPCTWASLMPDTPAHAWVLRAVERRYRAVPEGAAGAAGILKTESSP